MSKKKETYTLLLMRKEWEARNLPLEEVRDPGLSERNVIVNFPMGKRAKRHFALWAQMLSIKYRNASPPSNNHDRANFDWYNAPWRDYAFRLAAWKRWDKVIPPAISHGTYNPWQTRSTMLHTAGWEAHCLRTMGPTDTGRGDLPDRKTRGRRRRL